VRKQLDNKRTPLSWVQRAHIAVGAAQGLAYLHDLADPPVVHRDFKTSNILVMADYEARTKPFVLSLTSCAWYGSSCAALPERGGTSSSKTQRDMLPLHI